MNFKNFILSFFLLLPQFLFSQQREKMLIVSPDLFLAQLNGYIVEKEADMVDCQLVIVDSGESFQAIKQKIATAYSAFKADFLLLIGDFEHIPAYPLDEGLSDMQYGILSENAEPEMIVGRFSVENQVHLQTMIQRSLDYKNCSKTVLGIASKQRSELTQLTDFEQVRKMNALLENKGFHIKAELFEGVNEINPQEVINVLNQGVTWVNYAGYGSYQGWNTSGFSSQHIDSLSNSGELPIIFSAACLNGYFAQRECFAEKWLRAASNGNPTGARAVVMSSLLTDWDAVLIGMLQLCENVPASDNNCRLGTLYRQAYLHITNELQRKKEAQCWLLFGDPSMWIFPPAKTEIKEIPIPQSDFLYPNPAKNILTFTLKGKLQLFDLKGNLLQEIIIESDNELLTIKALQTGIYIAILYGENTVRVQKLIISH